MSKRKQRRRLSDLERQRLEQRQEQVRGLEYEPQPSVALPQQQMVSRGYPPPRKKWD
jgi:hypothetical protein